MRKMDGTGLNCFYSLSVWLTETIFSRLFNVVNKESGIKVVFRKFKKPTLLGLNSIFNGYSSIYYQICTKIKLDKE